MFCESWFVCVLFQETFVLDCILQLAIVDALYEADMLDALYDIPSGIPNTSDVATPAPDVIAPIWDMKQTPRTSKGNANAKAGPTPTKEPNAKISDKEHDDVKPQAKAIAKSNAKSNAKGKGTSESPKSKATKNNAIKKTLKGTTRRNCVCYFNINFRVCLVGRSVGSLGVLSAGISASFSAARSTDTIWQIGNVDADVLAKVKATFDTVVDTWNDKFVSLKMVHGHIGTEGNMFNPDYRDYAFYPAVRVMVISVMVVWSVQCFCWQFVTNMSGRIMVVWALL